MVDWSSGTAGDSRPRSVASRASRRGVVPVGRRRWTGSQPECAALARTVADDFLALHASECGHVPWASSACGRYDVIDGRFGTPPQSDICDSRRDSVVACTDPPPRPSPPCPGRSASSAAILLGVSSSLSARSSPTGRRRGSRRSRSAQPALVLGRRRRRHRHRLRGRPGLLVAGRSGSGKLYINDGSGFFTDGRAGFR